LRTSATGFDNKLWRTIIPEPRKQLIKNLCGVKYMGLPDMEKHSQLPDAPGSLREYIFLNICIRFLSGFYNPQQKAIFIPQ
jgi:hypothetical protein